MSDCSLPQFPDYKVTVSLFEDVSNAQTLRLKVSEIPFALIDARLICSSEQLYAAIYRALVETNYNKMRTKSLHSECLLCLAPSSNIGEAFRSFGIKDDSKVVIGVQILGPEDSNTAQQLAQLLQGTESRFCDDEVQKHYDEELIRKVCLPISRCSMNV